MPRPSGARGSKSDTTVRRPAGVPYPCFSTSGYADSAPGRLVQRSNVFTGSGPCETGGAVAEPRTWYAYTLAPAASVPALVRAGTGAGKIA